MVKLFEWIKENPAAALLLGLAGFLFWTAPIGFLQAWSALDHKTLPEWLAANGWPPLKYLLLGWYGLFAFVLMGMALLLIRASRKSNNALNHKAAERIRPMFDVLTQEERGVLNYILPLGRSPGNLNVGQLNALESIERKTGFVSRTFVGHYEVNQRVKESLEKLLANEELAKVKEPKAEQGGLVVSYNGGRYDHKIIHEGKVLVHTVRLQLENKSDRDINGIRVKAESFETLVMGQVQQVPLRIQHDHANQKKDGFSLTPGEKEMVDVVERESGSDTVRLCAAISGDFLTRESQFPLAVIITANGQPKQRKSLRVSQDDIELLRCVPLKS